MKLTIDKKNLVNLLSKTQNIVEKRNTMPVLVNVLLEAKGNELSVFATDLEVSFTDTIDAEVLEPGKIAVSAKHLFDIVKELDEQPLSLTSKKNNWLEISQKKSVFNVMGIDANEYPVFPTYETKGFFKISTDLLKEMIEKTIYSVSNDETRYHLNGVYFEQVEKDGSPIFRMVATDGHRLSLVERPVENPTGSTSVGKGVIIPRKGLQEIRKLLENLTGDVELAVEGSQLILLKDKLTLMIRLIEGKYPDYNKFIPANLSRDISINKESLMTSLRRVSLLSHQKSKGVTLSLNPGYIEITSNNPDLGDAKEEIEVNYGGEPLKIGFNARYILDVLGVVEDSEIHFKLGEQLSPGMIRPDKDQNYTCIVMPMRI